MVSSSNAAALFFSFFYFVVVVIGGASTASYWAPGEELSYSKHCASVVPAATRTFQDYSIFRFLEPSTSHYTGGDRILGQFFSTQELVLTGDVSTLYETDISGVYSIQARLIFHTSNIYYLPLNYSRGTGSNFSRTHVRGDPLAFRLNGFWSVTSRKLCMVGSAPWYSKQGNLLKLEAVLKLNIARDVTVLTSLVSGVLESSADSPQDPTYFEPIFILGLSRVSPSNYKYTLVTDEGRSGEKDYTHDSLDVCARYTGAGIPYEITYSRDCAHNSTQKCNPFGKEIASLLRFVSLYTIQSYHGEKSCRFIVKFHDSMYGRYDHTFDPKVTLIGEGWWDGTKKQLRIVACRILNQTDPWGSAYVGDCSIQLSLRYHSVLSIRKRHVEEGRIWTTKTVDDISYFESIDFSSSDIPRSPRSPGMKYNYTQLERVKKLCPSKKPAIVQKEEWYPDADSLDMWFSMSVKNWGYGSAVPIFVEDHLFARNPMIMSAYAPTVAPGNRPTANSSAPINISYKVSLTPLQNGSKWGSILPLLNFSDGSGSIQISAEGIYDSETGQLCMVGCRKLASFTRHSMNDDPMDCEVMVKFQFPRRYGNEGLTNGSIESMRKKGDALYFDSLELESSAFNHFEAIRSIWRMDLEIIMVLVSNTLLCIFIALQLFHLKKRPKALPFVSLVMLVILTLGHMLPLMLNFDALFFFSRNRQNVDLGSGGWLEVNEVAVRIVTMAAFLLQFRLLQLVWRGKSGDGSGESLWATEVKTLAVSLSVYVLGGSVALLVSWNRNRYENIMSVSTDVVERFVAEPYQRYSVWGSLKSYGGLVLDGFLFPQIIFNAFSHIPRERRALSCWFYVGTTLVRLLPHVYDLYRSNHYVQQQFDRFYIYANPRADFYSESWDIIIACGGVLFAMIVYLQQRFGGRWFLPQSFRMTSEYEKVPVVST